MLQTQDPGARIRQLLGRSLQGSGLSFDEDVRPWLGDRAGVAVTSLSGAQPNFALMVAAKDTDKAKEAIEKAQKGSQGSEQKRSYKEVSYRVDDGGNAAGIVGNYAVFATETAFKEVVDVDHGGDDLAESPAFKEKLETLGPDPLGYLFLDPSKLRATLSALGPQGAFLERFARGGPAVAGLTAKADLISIRVSGSAPPGAAGSPEAGADLLAGVPQDAWAAVSGAGFGDQVRQAYQGFGGGNDIIKQQIERQVESATGLDVQREVLGWIGDLTIFVRGTTVSDVRAELELTSTDRAASVGTIRQLGRLAQRQAEGAEVDLVVPRGALAGFTIRPDDSPVPITIAADEKTVTLGVGRGEGKEAGGGKLSANPTFRKAATALGPGLRPTFYLAVAPAVALLEATGTGGDQDYARAKPYLQVYEFLAAGGRRQGGEVSQSLVVGLR